jgi:hypothetical protein
MSEPAGTPPYRVAYSGRVRDGLKTLGARAKERGLGKEFLAAVRQLDERLRVYPQFGQPLYNLRLEPAQVWVGVVPPLVVQYSLDEERRLVMVASPIEPLPRSGLEP